MRLNLATMVAITIVAALFVKFAWGLPWTPFRIAGLAILIPAFVFLVVARIQLGRAFSVQARATQLVTTGLYSRIRNPIYVFGSLVLAGFILWSGRIWFLLIFALLVPLQIYRARKEEQVLAEKFGPAWLDYKQKTWF